MSEATPATPAERKQQLEAALRGVRAALDYPTSPTYTRYLREQEAKLEQELAELAKMEEGQAE